MMEYGSPNKLNELFNPPAREKMHVRALIRIRE